MKNKNGPLTRISPTIVNKTNHVFLVVEEGEIQGEHCPKGWYFWDEVGSLGGGPYSTEHICREQLHKYCQSLGEENNV